MEHKPQNVRSIRCEPSDGLHVFAQVQFTCDCGKRSWPHTTATFVIPDGETWRVSPLPTTTPAGWSA